MIGQLSGRAASMGAVPDRVLVSAAEAGAAVGVAPSTIRSWVARGHLAPAGRDGAWPLYDLDHVYDAERAIHADRVANREASAAHEAVAGRCVTVRADGKDCDRPAIPHSPVPLCRKHLVQVATFLADATDEVYRSVRSRARAPQDRPLPKLRPVVYFARLADRVKIGTTTQLAMRMAAINPDEVLRVLPGDVREERALHHLFASDRVRPNAEWFYLSADITAFITETADQDVRERVGVSV